MPVGVTKLKRSIMDETIVKDIAPLSPVLWIIYLISMKLCKMIWFYSFRMQMIFFRKRHQNFKPYSIFSDAGMNGENWKCLIIHKTTCLWRICDCCRYIICTKEVWKLRITDPMWGQFTGHRCGPLLRDFTLDQWIPFTSDVIKPWIVMHCCMKYGPGCLIHEILTV